MFTRLLFAFLMTVTSVAAQWEPLTVDTNSSFRGLHAVDENVVWSSGTNGTVIRTVNGGKNWDVRVVPGGEQLDFRGIRAWDAQTAIIASAGNAEEGLARIYKTIDGGLNWKLVLQEKTKGVFFDAIAFWDPKHGIVLSDPVNGRFVLFVTEDGGETWKQVPPERLPVALPNEGAFAASNSCLSVSGNADVWFVTGGANLARVFHSTDRGLSWSVAETPMHPANASTGLFSVAFSDAFHGVTVGGDYALPPKFTGSTIFFTRDGGKTWKPNDSSDAPNVFLSSVAIANTSREKSLYDLLVGGPLGIWARDASGNWQKESGENFNVVAQAASRVRWAVGPKGLVAKGK